MGPIVASDGSFLSTLNEFLEEETNIYFKMKNTLKSKYNLDYGYSERDRQLFNEQEKSYLLEVYSNGHVVLRINRKERDSYYKDLWLYIEYRDVDEAKKFFGGYLLVNVLTDVQKRAFFDLVSQSKDIISLGVGEPDFPTPWAIRRSSRVLRFPGKYGHRNTDKDNSYEKWCGLSPSWRRDCL